MVNAFGCNPTRKPAKPAKKDRQRGGGSRRRRRRSKEEKQNNKSALKIIQKKIK